LDLPVTSEQTVISLWQGQVEQLAKATGESELPLRVIVAQASQAPAAFNPVATVRTSVERDPKEFRGTAGVLRDVATSYDPNDMILVANGAQLLLEPLPALVADLFGASGSISFIAHEDGTPCGLFLIRCGALSEVRDIGFLDFKEQVLPKLGPAGHLVRPVFRQTATGLPLRTLDGYLNALRTFHRISAGLPRQIDPFSEDWQPTFSIVEPGANVDPSATIHDSVILKGATVGERAVVVRSVIGPDAVIRPDATIADRAIAARGETEEVMA
jgi:hypothetical protein